MFVSVPESLSVGSSCWSDSDQCPPGQGPPGPTAPSVRFPDVLGGCARLGRAEVAAGAGRPGGDGWAVTVRRSGSRRGPEGPVTRDTLLLRCTACLCRFLRCLRLCSRVKTESVSYSSEKAGKGATLGGARRKRAAVSTDCL